MKKLSLIKAGGTKRYRPDVVPTPKRQRSRRRNGRLVLDRRTARGRRLAELVEAYSTGANLQDERTLGLIKSTAAIAIEVEAMEDKIDRGETVDHAVFTKLVDARECNLERLRALRAQAQPSQAGRAPVPGGWSQPLYRYLHLMAWTGQRGGSTKSAKLVAEYERLEAEGAFKNAVR
jgi:hypothetical protein